MNNVRSNTKVSYVTIVLIHSLSHVQSIEIVIQCDEQHETCAQVMYKTSQITKNMSVQQDETCTLMYMMDRSTKMIPT